jgi:hypothetical protein
MIRKRFVPGEFEVAYLPTTASTIALVGDALREKSLTIDPVYQNAAAMFVLSMSYKRLTCICPFRKVNIEINVHDGGELVNVQVFA